MVDISRKSQAASSVFQADAWVVSMLPHMAHCTGP